MAVPLRHLLGGYGGILTGDDLHIGEGLQILLALAQGLLVGVDLRDVAPLGAGLHQQIVVHLQPHTADDAEIVLHHQIVNGIDAAGGAVFQRQHTVAAQSPFDSGKHCLKGSEVHDVRPLEQLVAGQLGIGPRHALAGHRHIGGEQLGGVVNGGADLPGQRGRGSQQPVLVAAAELKEQRIQRGGIVPQRLGGGLDGFLQLLPLPDWVQHRQAVLLLVGGDAGGGVHPLGKQLYQLAVDLVDPGTIITEFHRDSSLLRLAQQGVVYGDGRRGFDTGNGPWHDARVMTAPDPENFRGQGVQIHALLLRH